MKRLNEKAPVLSYITDLVGGSERGRSKKKKKKKKKLQLVPQAGHATNEISLT